MRTYRVAWLPGDGIGPEVAEAARRVLDAAGFPAEYLHGDIGWEFWRRWLCSGGSPALRARVTCAIWNAYAGR